MTTKIRYVIAWHDIGSYGVYAVTEEGQTRIYRAKTLLGAKRLAGRAARNVEYE